MITVQLQGGLGNQMFEYACGRALAVKNDTDLVLDIGYLLDRTPRKNFTFRDYALDVFTISAQTVSRKKPYWQMLLTKVKNKILKSKGIEKSFSYDPGVLSFGPSASLIGYWQSPKYFAGYEDVIRKDFALKEPLPAHSQQLLEEIKHTNSVAVHVRRGDFVDNPYHDIGLTPDYYSKGLAYIMEQYTIEKVYVFSDDIDWCKKNLHFSIGPAYGMVFVEKGHEGKHGEGNMILMSNCQHFIIPNSSFSWWAAWLGVHPDKTVIAPKRWFADSTIDTSDLIPKEWVRI
jgi:hypothetical protein